MSALKILVVGDVEGNFRDLFSKVTNAHAKQGPFEYLLCVGNFFGIDDSQWEDVKSEVIKAPVTTYILGPNKSEDTRMYPEKSGEMAPNIFFLGKRGILSGSTGLKIAYLSGTQGCPSQHAFSCDDVDELSAQYSSGAHGCIDILLSSEWPWSVTQFAAPLVKANISQEDAKKLDIGSLLLSRLVKEIKPRYHFSGLHNIFYERLPYRNHKILLETPVPVTRFVGLASVNNSKKSRWMYAFSIKPAVSMSSRELNTVTGSVTECPYICSYSHTKIGETKGQFFYDMNEPGTPKTKRQQNGDGEESAKKRKPQGPCWFCLTNPAVQKQLFISIGENCYITLAKGGIVPDHLLIVPLKHHQAVIDLPEEAWSEVEQYKSSLIRYFDSKHKDVIIFERNYASPHLQIQVIPVPRSLGIEYKRAITSVANSQNIDLKELSQYAVLKQIVCKRPYFYVEVVENKKSVVKFLHLIKQKFPLQFGRMLITSEHMLNVPERTDWKECQESPNQEKEHRENFRKEFKAFDFTE